jgi:hypothetical protein
VEFDVLVNSSKRICSHKCVHGICHDGECFCRYPYVGYTCNVEAGTEVPRALAWTLCIFFAATTSIIALLVFQPKGPLEPLPRVEDPHMADEEWREPQPG